MTEHEREQQRANMAAVDIGIAAIDRGDAKEFPSAAALVDYLKTIGAKARSVTSEAV